jgi:hypothetical protein
MNPLSPMWTPPKDFSTLYHIKTFSNQNTKNNFQNLNKHTQEYCGGRKFTFQKIVNEIHCRKLACTRSESTQKGEKIVYGIATLKIKYLKKIKLNAYSDGRRHKKTNKERKMVVNNLRETKGTTYNQKIRIS